jgi:site-specific recombinase XerD
LVIPPERENIEPRILTEDEIQRLLTVVQRPRDRAIIQLLLGTGIKLGEIVRLTLADIMVPRRISQDAWGTARILGAGRKKTRVLLLKRDMCEALGAWLKVRTENADSDALFLSTSGDPLSTSQFQKMICKYFRAAWIKDASIHTLRHTFAVCQLEMGTDQKSLKWLLGLKEKDTIRLYGELVKKRQSVA